MPTYSAILMEGDHSHDRVDGILEICAEERMKSILPWERAEGDVIYLQFARGNYLHDGDRVQVAGLSLILQVVPKPEEVLTVTAKNPQNLIRAAYHLGNRHVPLEIASAWLRFHPDPVIEAMLADMEVTITKELVPFYPEVGAYHRH